MAPRFVVVLWPATEDLPAACRVRRTPAADCRLDQLGIAPLYGSTNPFAFMELQDVQELSNFFERRGSAYQVGVSGGVGFDEAFWSAAPCLVLR
jgi:ribonucleoside-diphosphate reductase beta chain